MSHALSAGSIVSAGELLAKLELKDPSKAPGEDMGRWWKWIWLWVKTKRSPFVNIKIVGKWMFTPLALRIIGFDTHPYEEYIRICCLMLFNDVE